MSEMVGSNYHLNQRNLIIAAVVFFVCCLILKHHLSLQDQKTTNLKGRNAKHHQILRNRNKKVRNQIHRSTSRKVVFIVAQGRTGSSLLGELFNTLDNFLYFHEPLRGIENFYKEKHFLMKNGAKRKAYARQAKEFVEDIINCRFRKFNDQYLSHLKGSFQQKTGKLFMSPSFCEAKTSKCVPLNFTIINTLCKGNSKSKRVRANVAIKELVPRLPTRSIKFLKRLRMRRGTPLYVIHLVRDPRAYLFSHRNRDWFAKNAKEVHREEDISIMQRCGETEHNIKMIAKEVGRKGRRNLRYMVLRFEDIALFPIRESVRLSRFLGLNLTTRFLQYFMKKLKGSEKRGNGNVKHAINKWRLSIDLKFVRKVEYACERVMKLLGYKVAKGETELRKTNYALVINRATGKKRRKKQVRYKMTLKI